MAIGSLVLGLFISPHLWAESSEVSGIPRLIRSSPQTEIFFSDLNTSYVIPQNDKHNEVFQKIAAAIKSRSAIKLKVDKKTRQILGLTEAVVQPSLEKKPEAVEQAK